MTNIPENNAFVVLGITGVGKSTLCRILSEDESIKIGETTSSCTKNVSYHKCNYNNFVYTIIDTPGFNDTEGEQEDKTNYEYIKNIFTNNKYKLKGILIVFNFQENKFLPYHEKSLKKIIGLMPIYEFWSYVTLVFTHSTGDEFNDLETLKSKKLTYYKPCINKIIDDANLKKKIKIVNFEEIKCHFISINHEKVKKERLSELIKDLESKKNFEPLYHNIKIEYFSENKLKELDYGKYKLYNCTYEKTIYKNKNGTVLREQIKLKNMKFIKNIEDPNFVKDVLAPVEEGTKITGGFTIPSICLHAVGIASIFYCPPLAFVCWAAGTGTGIYAGLGPSFGLYLGGRKFINNIINNVEKNQNNYTEFKDKDYTNNEEDEYC